MGGGGYLVRNDSGKNVVWKALSGGTKPSDVTSQIDANGDMKLAGVVSTEQFYLSLPESLPGVYTQMGTDFTVGSSSGNAIACYDNGNFIKFALKNDGSIISQGDAREGAEDGSVVFGGSGFSASWQSAGGLIYRGYTTGNSTPTFSVTAGGNITASGIDFNYTTYTPFGIRPFDPGGGNPAVVPSMAGEVYTAGLINLGSGSARWRDVYGTSARMGNVFIETELDNPDAWETKTESYEEQITGPQGRIEKTVTKTREVQEYVGATLSVKDELIALRKRATQQDAVIAQLVTALRSQGVQIDTTDIQEGN